MGQSADRLKTQLTDAKTVALELAALSRIRELVQNLKSDAGNSKSPENENEEAAADQQNNADGVPLIAQLKLVKTLQEDLLRRTGELDQRRRGGTDLSARRPTWNSPNWPPNKASWPC